MMSSSFWHVLITFLIMAFLSLYQTEVAASEVLKGTQLKDFFNPSSFHDLIIQILDTWLSKGTPHHWVSYLMPGDTGAYKLAASSSTSDSNIALATKYELLMAETRAVVSSAEFGNIVDILLRALVSMLLEDLISEFGGSDLVSGMPLVKLLPRIARVSELLHQESSRSKYIQNIQTIPEVELFFTLLYSSTPTS